MIRRISSPNWSLGTRFWGQLFRQLAEQPGPAQRPKAIGGATADPQRFGSLLVRKPSKVAQLYQPGRVGIVALQPCQRLVQGDEIVGTDLGGCEVLGEIDAQPVTAVLVGLLPPGLLHE